MAYSALSILLLVISSKIYWYVMVFLLKKLDNVPEADPLHKVSIEYLVINTYINNDLSFFLLRIFSLKLYLSRCMVHSSLSAKNLSRVWLKPWLIKSTLVGQD